MNKEILETKLQNVAGGSGREKTVRLTVNLPSTNNLNKVTVFIDGTLESSLCNEYDSCIETIYLEVKGTVKSKIVEVKVNNLPYKSYTVDFEKGTYQEY